MIDLSECSTRTLRLALPVAAAALCLPALVNAQEITLQSIDGSVQITGTLQKYENNFYTVEYESSVLRVDGSLVECIGDNCPSTNVATGPVTWDVSVLHAEHLLR